MIEDQKRQFKPSPDDLLWMADMVRLLPPEDGDPPADELGRLTWAVNVALRKVCNEHLQALNDSGFGTC